MSYIKNPKLFFNTPLPQKYKQDNFGFLKVVIIAVLFGFFSGLVGSQISQTYLHPARLANILETQPIIQPKITTVPKDAINLLPFLSFEKKQVTLYPNSQEAFLTKDSALGRGIILTSDGWVFTSGNLVEKKEDIRVATYDGILYTLSLVVYDPFTNVSFLKISADNLSVASFKQFDRTNKQDTVYIADNNDTLKEYVISQKDYSLNTAHPVSSSDRIEERIILEPAVADGMSIGSPIFSEDGEILAMVTEVDQGVIMALAVEFLENAMNEVLERGTIEKRNLNFSYINLGRVLATDATMAQRKQGVLLADSKEHPFSKSIFSKVLHVGDIITDIDGKRVFAPYPIWHLLRSAAMSRQEVVVGAIDAKTKERIEISLVVL